MYCHIKHDCVIKINRKSYKFEIQGQFYTSILLNLLRLTFPPVRARGVKSGMCPPYPQRDRKRRLIWALCRNHRIKRLVPYRCLDGHVKEPCEMSMALEARP